MQGGLRRRGQDPTETDGLLTQRDRGAEESEARRSELLEHMRQRCSVPFDNSVSEHEDTLKSIWAFSLSGMPFKIPSDEWKALGFQGRDPRTDLRGCGFMGLVHLKHFLSKHRAQLAEALSGTPQSAASLSSFPLSIASINCSAMLLSHLHLAPKLTCSFLPGGREEAPLSTLHGFLSLGAASWEEEEDANGVGSAKLERALERMHAHILVRLLHLFPTHRLQCPSHRRDSYGPCSCDWQRRGTR
jgi:hypothetical protein